MNYSIKETLTDIVPSDMRSTWLYTVDGAPSHVHTGVASTAKEQGVPLYISSPNSTPFSQACDKS